MTDTTIPAGSVLLGRVLSSNGEPIDQKGSLANARRVPLYTPVSSAETARTAPQMLETGIKAIDLMAPVPYGGVAGVVGGYGVGKQVVMDEIMHNLMTRRDYVVVIAGMSETTYDASEVREMVRELEAEERIAMVFEQATSDLAVRQRLLRAAMTIAAKLRDEGRETLLLVDDDIILSENLADLRDVQQFAASKGITTFMFGGADDADAPADSRVVSELDAVIKLSKARAKQGLWPAIDPLASHSRLLESDAVSAEHRQLVGEVRQLLQRYSELQRQALDVALTEEDRHVLARDERVNLFFTQPFFVAEAYTDLPGEYLTTEETIASFRDLLAGRYDDVPARSFHFVGTIAQAISRAK